MAKRGIYVKQNINRRRVYLAVLFVCFFEKCSYSILRVKRQKHRQKLICQNNKLSHTSFTGKPIMHYTKNVSQQMVITRFCMVTK